MAGPWTYYLSYGAINKTSQSEDNTPYSSLSTSWTAIANFTSTSGMGSPQWQSRTSGAFENLILQVDIDGPSGTYLYFRYYINRLNSAGVVQETSPVSAAVGYLIGTGRLVQLQITTADTWSAGSIDDKMQIVLEADAQVNGMSCIIYYGTGDSPSRSYTSTYVSWDVGIVGTAACTATSSGSLNYIRGMASVVPATSNVPSTVLSGGIRSIQGTTSCTSGCSPSLSSIIPLSVSSLECAASAGGTLKVEELIHIERTVSGEDDWTFLCEIPFSSEDFHDDTAEIGIEYCYRAYKIDGDGNVHDWSNIACVLFGIPPTYMEATVSCTSDVIDAELSNDVYIVGTTITVSDVDASLGPDIALESVIDGIVDVDASLDGQPGLSMVCQGISDTSAQVDLQQPLTSLVECISDTAISLSSDNSLGISVICTSDITGHISIDISLQSSVDCTSDVHDVVLERDLFLASTIDTVSDIDGSLTNVLPIAASIECTSDVLVHITSDVALHTSVDIVSSYDVICSPDISLAYTTVAISTIDATLSLYIGLPATVDATSDVASAYLGRELPFIGDHLEPISTITPALSLRCTITPSIASRCYISSTKALNSRITTQLTCQSRTTLDQILGSVVTKNISMQSYITIAMTINSIVDTALLINCPINKSVLLSSYMIPVNVGSKLW